MPTVPFSEWMPDQPEMSDGSRVVQNVFPRTRGTYGPMRALTEVGNALNSPCKGAGSFMGSDNTIVTFAGTATKLYLWNGADTWTDVTRLSGDYTMADEHRWVFEQIGNTVYADNGIDTPQSWVIGLSSRWAAATGSPPISKYLAAVDNGFLMRANTPLDNRETQWSEQFNSNGWVIGQNQSDTQVFQEGGKITGLVGGENPVWFQQKKIRRGIYTGPDAIFQINEISRERGCVVPGSIAAYQRTIIFLANDGFYRLDAEQALTPIGEDKVDETIWANINQDNFNACWSLIDPRRKAYYFAWPSSSGIADTLWICNLNGNRWAPSSYDMECLFFMYAEVSIDLDTDIDVADQNLDGSGLPSLDSEAFAGSPIPKLACFTPNHKLAFFDGPTLEATIDTSEAQIGDGFSQVEVDRVIPLVTGGNPSISAQGKIGLRNRQQDAVTYSGAVGADAFGDQYFREPAARFHIARQVLPAGMEFQHAIGVDFLPSSGGDR